MTDTSDVQKIRPGTPRPLGATVTTAGTNFAVFSESATRIDICVFDDAADEPSRIYTLPEKTANIWHGEIPGISAGTRYGLRAWGDWNPAAGLRFNENKLLLDPYARAIDGSVQWGPEMFSHQITDPPSDTTRSDLPNDGAMPKGIVTSPEFNWKGDKRPRTNWYDTVIYEVHVKGFTATNRSIPAKLRGTYAGLGHRKSIQYLKELGVTAVELLPVHSFVDDEFLTDRDLTNYWGYSTLNFFAPDARYAADKSPGGVLNEFRSMVQSLHKAGIEVILDVVFNHTCEGNHLGPTLSFKGIDNRNYYRLKNDKPGEYENYAGTGNTVNVVHPQVMTMVMDSLRYWVEEMHVDGFRFDLGVVLGREHPDFSAQAGFFAAVHQDPVLSDVKMIAEPWDLGPGGYQVGHFPLLWSEWNDKFRDDVRTFWQTTQPVLPSIGYRLTGSSDLYEASGRRPRAGGNFVVSHDGYSLRDLVSYTQKHNQANGEGNQDGHNHNISANYGVEGDTKDKDIDALRWRQMRNMLATLLFSQGVPMICGGDEVGRTQGGNNNAYAQDNEVSWFNWKHSADQNNLMAFTRRAIDVRMDHAALRRRFFFRGMPQTPDEMKDVTWCHPGGWEMSDQDWSNPALQTIGMRLDGGAILDLDQHGNPENPSSILLIFHAGEDDIEFTLPAVDRGEDLDQWVAMISTDSPTGEIDFSARGNEKITVPARTVILFHPSDSSVG